MLFLLISLIAMIGLNLIFKALYLLSNEQYLRMQSQKNDKLNLLIEIYANASNFYYIWAQKGLSVADYAYLAEAALLCLVRELNGENGAITRKTKEAIDKGLASQKSHGISMKQITDSDINKMIDDWENKNPGWRDKYKDDE